MNTYPLYQSYIDETYREFSKRLSPSDTLPRLGIRIPVLRKLAKTLNSEDIDIVYHEDVMLKALVICYEKIDFTSKWKKLETLFPYLSSWDQTDLIASSLKVRKEEADKAFLSFQDLTKSPETFQRRLGIVLLLSNRKVFPREKTIETIVKADDHTEYYVSMAVAWALSFFYFEDSSYQKYFTKVSEITQKRTWQKIKDSRRTSANDIS